MCMEDVRLSRDTKTVVTTVTVGITSGVFLAPDPRRIAFAVSSPPTNRFTILPGPVVALDGGINLYPLGSKQHFTIYEMGESVVQGWSGISAVGAQTVVVVETILEAR